MDTSSIERYDALAEEFYREFRVMAPGKDIPAAMGSYDEFEVRHKLWRYWLDQRDMDAERRARAVEAAEPVAWCVTNADGDVVGIGESRGAAVYVADFGCDENVRAAFENGENGPYHGFRIERLYIHPDRDPLAEARVVEAAVAYESVARGAPPYSELEEAHTALLAAVRALTAAPGENDE